MLWFISIFGGILFVGLLAVGISDRIKSSPLHKKILEIYKEEGVDAKDASLEGLRKHYLSKMSHNYSKFAKKHSCYDAPVAVCSSEFGAICRNADTIFCHRYGNAVKMYQQIRGPIDEDNELKYRFGVFTQLYTGEEMISIMQRWADIENNYYTINIDSINYWRTEKASGSLSATLAGGAAGALIFGGIGGAVLGSAMSSKDDEKYRFILCINNKEIVCLEVLKNQKKDFDNLCHVFEKLLPK